MKLWMIYLIRDNRGDDLPDDVDDYLPAQGYGGDNHHYYQLYGWTHDKKILKRFELERNMKLFKVLGPFKLTEDELYSLDFYDEKFECVELEKCDYEYKVDHDCRYLKGYTFISNAFESTFVNAWATEQLIHEILDIDKKMDRWFVCFKNRYQKAFDRLGMDHIFDLALREYAGDNPPWGEGLRCDNLYLFLKIFGFTLNMKGI